MGVHDFHSPDVQKETVPELADIITNGKNKMPKYAGKLKDSEIKDLAAYVHELGKEVTGPDGGAKPDLGRRIRVESMISDRCAEIPMPFGFFY